MAKYMLPLFIATTLFVFSGSAQSDSFDVYKYQAPEFFTKSELSNRVQFSLKNNDSSFCIITIYKSEAAQADIMKDVMEQWNKQVVKQLTKVSKKPARILTEQMWEGWTSSLAMGNFYQHKKKSIVMLNSFRRDKKTAYVVYAFSDKIFKPVIEKFSTNIHLTQKF